MKGDFWYCKNEAQRNALIEHINNLELGEFGLQVQIARGRATNKQKGCVYLYCRLLAKELESGGFDMREVLKVDADIPPDEYMVKTLIWNRVMKAMTGKTSITKLDRKEISEIYSVIQRHMAQSFSIMVPFPSNEPPMV